MKRVSLKIEHKFKNRVVGHHLIDGERKKIAVGSSRSADLRLVGDDVAGVHAVFEREQDGWKISDLGSESGTWIHQKPIVEHELNGATVIHIGGHQLKATPHVLDRDLFAKPVTASDGALTYHQVVVLKNKLVVASYLLAKTAPYQLSWGGHNQTMPAPSSEEWTETAVGDLVVKQRLAKSDIVEESARDRLSRSIEPGVHGPLISAIVVFVLIFAVLLLAPRKPDDQLKKLTPENNRYTRLIFDGKKMRENKIQAEKMRKRMVGQSRTGVRKPNPGGQKATAGARVVSRIKAAGLGALIGKISKRAAKNGVFLQAAGVSPDSKSSGRALGLGGGSLLDKLGHGKGGGHSERIAGVGTVGKGGGHGGFKGTGALSLGNVGNAEVGVIDDETEIQGGLDKDVIARVIKSQLGQIRYCYERQLSANPDLYGKVLVKFTIGASGSVIMQAIGNSSLKNAMVEGCILRRVAGWTFPMPKGGTNVLVTYPFLFKSTR